MIAMYSPHLLFPSSWLSIISLLDLSLPPSLFASFLRRSSVKFLSLLVYRYCDLFLWFLSRYYLCIFFFWILHLICLGIIFCCCFLLQGNIYLCLVFSELPGPVIWCLTLTWALSQLLLQILFLPNTFTWLIFFWIFFTLNLQNLMLN